jgi:small conductance mechanosensitive channel
VQTVSEAMTTTEACGADPGIVCEAVFELTDNRTLARFAEWLTTVPFHILLIVVGAMVVNRLARRAISRFVDRLVRERTVPDLEDVPLIGAISTRAVAGLERLTERTERSRQRAETLGALLRSLATGTIFVVALLLVLGELDINLGPLIAGAGIAGVAVGLGAQSIIRDFLAGMFIVIEDQYGVGDVVDVGDVTATVERVSWRTTWLRDVEGSVWVVPNGNIRRVANKSQLWSRTVLDVSVTYDTDLDRAMAVLKETADEVWRAELPKARIIEAPEVWGVEAFSDSSITLRLVVKTEPGAQWRVAREIRTRLKPAFARAGIGVPSQPEVAGLSGPDDPEVPPAVPAALLRAAVEAERPAPPPGEEVRRGDA